MQKQFLIIDKEQRIDTKTTLPYAVSRLIEEIDKKGYKYDYIPNSQINIKIDKNITQIFAGVKPITEYTNIILRGFSLHNSREYELYQYIAQTIKFHNERNPSKPIKLLNQEALLNIPHYNKIAFGIICTQNNIPYFNSDYPANIIDKKSLKFPVIIKEYAGVNDIRLIDGEEKVKKNVYKVSDLSDFDQEFLRDKNLADFFVQEYSDTGEDYRIFVAKDVVIGGWKRIAKNSFMTVSKGEYQLYNQPSEDIKALALQFSKAVNADFIAVDVMYNNSGIACLQEISLHPGFKAYETKIEGNNVNLAKVIVDCADN